MHVNPDLVGTELQPMRVSLTARQVMAYAAGVGDANPVFLDDSREGGIIAHPLMVTALTWPMGGDLQRAAGDGLPAGVISRMVHATEDLQFFAPIRPIGQITISGIVAAVQPRKSGTMLMMRYELRNDDDSLLAIEHTGAILRGVDCDSNGRELPDTPLEITPPEAEPDPRWQAELEVSPTAAHVYDACSDIHFPIHTSNAFARAVGLPGIILQGTASLAMLTSSAIEREAGGDPLKVARIGARFLSTIKPGERCELICSGDGAASRLSLVNSRHKRAVHARIEWR